MQRPDRLTVTWLGHSTVLLELDGTRIVTDPVLRARVGPLRRVAPAVGAPGRVDAALISHVHYDHLDAVSLRSVEAARVVVPRGAGRLRSVRGLASLSELAPGEEVAVAAVRVRATFAQHAARRHPLAPPTPALGYLVTGSTAVYFAGDTDLFEGMRALAPSLDVALLPVSGWGPRLPPGHLTPERAARALTLLRPRLAIPIHWGTYRRIGLREDAAALRRDVDLFAERARDLAPEVEVRILPPGGATEVEPGAS